MGSEFKSILNKYFSQADILLTQNQLNLFEIYKDHLLDWNKKINLTSIVDDEGIILKHFLDSSIILNHIDLKNNKKIIDVGSGAGFPAIPIKILNDSFDVTLVDSLNKRVNFLNFIISKLELKGIRAIHSRAEDLASNPDYRESYDYCVARAVTKLRDLSEYCLPFVYEGGQFLAYKGYDIDQEKQESLTAIATLGGEIENIIRYSILEQGKRSIVVVKKVSQTPTKYPRNKAKMIKQPLN